MSANPSMMKTNAMHDSAVKMQGERSRFSLTQSRAGHSAGHSIEYRITYALVFIVCLAITGLCRLLPRNRHPWITAGDNGTTSLWSEARSAADSTVPYVFQQ